MRNQKRGVDVILSTDFWAGRDQTIEKYSSRHTKGVEARWSRAEKRYVAMKFFFLLLLVFTSSALADYPLYIEELADIVNWEDENILERLEEDYYSPRFEILARVHQILARQSPALQAAYRALVSNKENTRAARVAHMLRQHEMRGTAEIFRRIVDIQGDLRLSHMDAKKLTRDLKRMLF